MGLDPSIALLTNNRIHSDTVFCAQGFLRHAHQDTVVNVLDDSQGLVSCVYSYCGVHNIRLTSLFCHSLAVKL